MYLQKWNCNADIVLRFSYDSNGRTVTLLTQKQTSFGWLVGFKSSTDIISPNIMKTFCNIYYALNVLLGEKRNKPK